MIIGTFLESYDLTGVDVYPFTQSDSMDTEQFNNSISFVRESAAMLPYMTDYLRALWVRMPTMLIFRKTDWFSKEELYGKTKNDHTHFKRRRWQNYRPVHGNVIGTGSQRRVWTNPCMHTKRMLGCMEP